MTPPAIVEHLHVLEDDLLSLLTGVAGLKIDTCGLSGVEKTLRYRIIPTIPFPTPTGCDPVVMKKLQGTIGPIVRASVGVHDQAWSRLTLIKRHL